jgi:hypothetical protein
MLFDDDHIPSTTELWLDTEFNGFDGAFISAALVAEDGRSWYETVGCADPIPWAAENVMPVLNKKPVTFNELQRSLKTFLQTMEDIVIVADWPTDIMHFCDLLRVRPHTGSVIHVPPITFKLKTWLQGSGMPSRVPHNALEDALAIMGNDCETRGGRY